MSEREDLNSLLSRVGGSGDVQNFGRTSMDHSSTPQTPTRWLKYSFSGHELSEEETLQSRSFQIRPRPDGFNSGRLYYLRAENNIECERFMSEIKALIKEAQKQVQEATRFSWIQHCAKQVYDSQIFQGISMLLIVAVIEINFFCALFLLNCGTFFSFQNFALSIAASQANIANQPYPGPGSFWSPWVLEINRRMSSRRGKDRCGALRFWKGVCSWLFFWTSAFLFLKVGRRKTIINEISVNY